VKLPNAQTRPDGAEIQDELQNLTGGRSVPRVFIGGAFVGGAVRTWMLPFFFFFFSWGWVALDCGARSIEGRCRHLACLGDRPDP
jgi:hypothetical protein